MRRVVFNQKGGVGKSTITCNLAAIAAARGQNTLVVDLDPQGNTSQYLLGEDTEAMEDTLAGFFDQMLSFRLYPATALNLSMKRPMRIWLSCRPIASWVS